MSVVEEIVLNFRPQEPEYIVVDINGEGEIVVVRDVESSKIEIVSDARVGPRGPAGLQGPPGAPGISAGGAAFFEQIFAIPSDTWVINHNLGFPPAVTLYNPLGQQQRGTIIFNDASQTIVTYYFPVAGRATCS